MEFTVENVCGLLIRSKLLTPEEVRAAYARWQTESGQAVSNLAAFTRWLVAHQYVTEYQASLVARGHADGFFINQYKIIDRLGKGRTAGVYKSMHQSGQIVAIKVLPPSKSKNTQLLRRFKREVKLALKLKHPNVVRSFQVGTVGELHYLVMEYLEGETLDVVLQRRKKLPPQEAVRLIHQALQGLQYIHEQGLVHRDLKPANLILVPAGGSGADDTTLRSTLKILDIGLGRRLVDDGNQAATENLHLTGEGVLLGTPDYLAPEQARDPRAVDIRADIYSLGCVLYHALTGQPPFPDTNILSQMVRHATETARPLKELNPAVPDGLQQIINWMLAKDPAQRYPTPERAAQALQMFLVAGAEPPKLAEEGPQLRKFLTCLETERNGDAALDTPPKATPALPAAPPPAAKRDKRDRRSKAHPPTATPVTQPPSAAPGQPSRPPVAADAGKHRHGHKKHKRHRTSAAPVAAPVAAPAASIAPSKPTPVPAAAGFDVELVPAAPVQPAAQGFLRLSNRDWLLLGLGAGAVIIAGVIGLVLAMTLRSG